ncbi:hypothetical protein GBN15_11830 [Plesiomonas shigelloides]|nr:hypothetical protein GBN15_11830 [Plesiomonas shigelloides]
MLMGIHSLAAYLQLQVVWVYIRLRYLSGRREIPCICPALCCGAMWGFFYLRFGGCAARSEQF